MKTGHDPDRKNGKVEHHLSQKSKKIALSPIQEIALLAEDMEDVISLGWGVPSFVTPIHIREAVQKALANDVSIGIYSTVRGLPNLREAISMKFERQNGVRIDPYKEIIVTVGAMEALLATLLTLIDVGDEVILTSPGFGAHREQVLLAGGNPVYINLHEEDGWVLDVRAVKQLVSGRTKAMILVNPSNPTGTIFDEYTLRSLAALAIESDFYLIVDETYRYLTYEHAEIFNLFSLPDLRNRLVGCYSFSKEYAMTGWRVGYLCAEERLVDEILKTHDASVVSAPRISQVAALAALQGSQDCVQQFRRDLERRRNLICECLDSLKEIFDYQKPQGTYYVFPRIKHLAETDIFLFALKLLNDAKIAVAPGTAFNYKTSCHIRLCFAQEDTEIIKGFDRLEHFMKTNNRV